MILRVKNIWIKKDRDTEMEGRGSINDENGRSIPCTRRICIFNVKLIYIDRDNFVHELYTVEIYDY